MFCFKMSASPQLHSCAIAFLPALQEQYHTSIYNISYHIFCECQHPCSRCAITSLPTQYRAAPSRVFTFLLYFVKCQSMTTDAHPCEQLERMSVFRTRHIIVSYLRCQRISSYCLQAMIYVAAYRISNVPYIHPDSSCLPQDTRSAVITW